MASPFLSDSMRDGEGRGGRSVAGDCGNSRNSGTAELEIGARRANREEESQGR